VPAQHQGADLGGRDPQLPRQEGAQPGGVEDPGHADHPLAREAGGLEGDVAHRVQRVGDHDHDRVGRSLGHRPADLAHDLAVGLEQVLAAHVRLARQPGGDHDDVRAAGLVVVIGSAHAGVVPPDGTRLIEVQRLALREPLLHVDQDQLGVAALGQLVRGGCPHVAGPDDSDLASHP
jgi:hypothetical protein